jgi:hypothetical protein
MRSLAELIWPFRVEMSQAALDAERRQAMSYSVSTLLIRNLRDVFGENDPARRRAAIDEITLKIAFSTTPARESIVAVTKSTASRARSKLLSLNSDISQLPSLRNRAMAGWSAGYRASRVRRQLTPGLISSLSETAGLPSCISFSTNYPDLDSAVRRPMLRIGKRREEYFAVAQAALLEAKHRKSIGNPGEKRLSA